MRASRGSQAKLQEDTSLQPRPRRGLPVDKWHRPVGIKIEPSPRIRDDIAETHPFRWPREAY